MSHQKVIDIATERFEGQKKLVNRMQEQVAGMKQTFDAAQRDLSRESIQLMACQNALEMIKEGFKDDKENKLEMVGGGECPDTERGNLDG